MKKLSVIAVIAIVCMCTCVIAFADVAPFPNPNPNPIIRDPDFQTVWSFIAAIIMAVGSFIAYYFFRKKN